MSIVSSHSFHFPYRFFSLPLLPPLTHLPLNISYFLYGLWFNLLIYSRLYTPFVYPLVPCYFTVVVTFITLVFLFSSSSSSSMSPSFYLPSLLDVFRSILSSYCVGFLQTIIAISPSFYFFLWHLWTISIYFQSASSIRIPKNIFYCWVLHYLSTTVKVLVYISLKNTSFCEFSDLLTCQMCGLGQHLFTWVWAGLHRSES